jgi:hypothetical protein
MSMPKRYFKMELSDRSEIHVFFETASGIIISFVIKLIVNIHDTYYEVIRFDSGHGCPHKDILDVQGEVIRKIWYEFLDNKQALDIGIKDLKDNHELYIERFMRWLKP